MGHRYMLGEKQQTNIIKRFFIQIKNIALLRKACSRNTHEKISLKYKLIV